VPHHLDISGDLSRQRLAALESLLGSDKRKQFEPHVKAVPIARIVQAKGLDHKRLAAESRTTADAHRGGTSLAADHRRAGIHALRRNQLLTDIEIDCGIPEFLPVTGAVNDPAKQAVRPSQTRSGLCYVTRPKALANPGAGDHRLSVISTHGQPVRRDDMHLKSTTPGQPPKRFGVTLTIAPEGKARTLDNV
jgi:hypothetical protein